ncbi:hypothetical protein ACFLR4_02425 [Bacteroidota bacterium]
MEKKRIFRQDYIPLNEAYKFKSGDVATIIAEGKKNVKIKIGEKPYLLPYREFIILTRKQELD